MSYSDIPIISLSGRNGRCTILKSYKSDKEILYVKIYNEITKEINKYKLTEIKKIDKQVLYDYFLKEEIKVISPVWLKNLTRKSNELHVYSFSGIYPKLLALLKKRGIRRLTN